MPRYILAHDLGTSGDKATLFTEEGRLVKSYTRSYSTHYFNGNWAEQDPEDWWKAVVESTRRIVEGIDPADVAAIGFSGQMLGCLCVDTQGRPLRPSLIYCDQRATVEAERLLGEIEAYEFYEISGQRISSSYSAAKLMWIRDHEPDVYSATHKILNAKDFINFRLTGNLCTDYSDGASTSLLDIRSLTWSERIVGIADLDGEKLPEAKASTSLVGEITRAAAGELGLVPGIPVIAGAGDGVCAGIGSGSVRPGVTYNYLGSSGWISTTTTEPLYDPQMRTFIWPHAVPGLYHPCGSVQTAGASYAWARDKLCGIEKAAAAELGLDAYELMNAEILGSPPGANGLVFLPYMLGERSPRWNPEAKGALLGLTLGHTRNDMLRAFMEGVAINLSTILDIFRTTIDIPSIVLVGGGAKGGVWRKIMADVYEAEILCPDYLEEATSMGAAIIAGVGSGVFRDFSVAKDFMRIADSTLPDPANYPAYRRKKELFEDSYRALEPLFPRMTP
jgi:xylulokinase